jgi:hypothetical protein
MSKYKTVLASLAGAVLASAALSGATAPISPQLTLLNDGRAPTVLNENNETLGLAAALLQRDLNAVTGQQSQRIERLDQCARVCFVIGRRDSALMQEISRAAGVELTGSQDQWERYERMVVAAPGRPDTRLVLIAGSDTRGSVYGVIDLTREIGVSAWEWWADVKPQVRPDASISATRRLADGPSVQYRGVFLNDEDWGLQPWAARHDPAGDIGPATYARIFELLWRLKANLIWPAMHESTRPFYQIQGNAETARRYAIVVGTSHAEPMMRNNVREWDLTKRGAFNFFTNRDQLAQYWSERLEEVRDFDNMYSVGIRGVHDSAMEGAATVEQARDGVKAAIDLQRALLSKVQSRPAAQIPQALTLYKEVLDIYKAGLTVPDDITLLWPDDNYGYLRQLSTPDEAQRSGGAGLYYHLSYWGQPHDYLWLATTHPALIRDQLQRAVATGARKIWVANVGDIKPGEYLMEYFLDAAFDARKLDAPPREHGEWWMSAQFGSEQGPGIAAIMQEYYDLAWERRPEFMGFSQVEPITPTRQSPYLQDGGEEAERRLERYMSLVERAQAVAERLPADRQDAYYQLVLYPVRSSANLNTRILRLDLASQYARMGRPIATLYAQQAAAAQNAIARDTARYNALGNGKWEAMMDAAPRRLPVFGVPLFPSYSAGPRKDCALVYPTVLSGQDDTLSFTRGVAEARTLSVVNFGARALSWSLPSSPPGLVSSRQEGELSEANGFEQRITIRYDGRSGSTRFPLRCGDAELNVRVKVSPGTSTALPAERERIVILAASDGSPTPGWTRVVGLGSTGASMRADFTLPSRELADAASAPSLSYEFATSSSGLAHLKFVDVPVHPLTSANRLRLAYSLDNAPPQLLDFETHGRSDEWKANVLSNTAVRVQTLPGLQPGRHKLRIHALDPGVVLDRIEISFDGARRYYGKP